MMLLAGPGVVELRSMSGCCKAVDLWDYQNKTMELSGMYTIVCIICNCQIWIKMEEEELPVSNIKEHLSGNHHRQVMRDSNRNSSMEILCHCSGHGSQDVDEEGSDTDPDTKDPRCDQGKNSNFNENETQILQEDKSEKIGSIEKDNSKEDGGVDAVTHKSTHGFSYCLKQNRYDERKSRQSKCLGVFGLSQITSEKELRRKFEKFGRIEKVRFSNASRRVSKRYALLFFECKDDANEAQKKMHCSMIDGETIRVEDAFQTRARTPALGRKYVGSDRRSSKWDKYGNRSRRPRGYGGGR